MHTFHFVTEGRRIAWGGCVFYVVDGNVGRHSVTFHHPLVKFECRPERIGCVLTYSIIRLPLVSEHSTLNFGSLPSGEYNLLKQHVHTVIHNELSTFHCLPITCMFKSNSVLNHQTPTSPPLVSEHPAFSLIILGRIQPHEHVHTAINNEFSTFHQVTLPIIAGWSGRVFQP